MEKQFSRWEKKTDDDALQQIYLKPPADVSEAQPEPPASSESQTEPEPAPVSVPSPVETEASKRQIAIAAIVAIQKDKSLSISEKQDRIQEIMRGGNESGAAVPAPAPKPAAEAVPVPALSPPSAKETAEEQDAKPPAKETSKDAASLAPVEMDPYKRRAAILKDNSLTPKEKQARIQEIMKGGNESERAAPASPALAAPPAEETAEETAALKRKAIQAVYRDTTLTAQEKHQRVQALQRGEAFPAPSAASASRGRSRSITRSRSGSRSSSRSADSRSDSRSYSDSTSRSDSRSYSSDSNEDDTPQHVNEAVAMAVSAEDHGRKALQHYTKIPAGDTAEQSVSRMRRIEIQAIYTNLYLTPQEKYRDVQALLVKWQKERMITAIEAIHKDKSLTPKEKQACIQEIMKGGNKSEGVVPAPAPKPGAEAAPNRPAEGLVTERKKKTVNPPVEQWKKQIEIGLLKSLWSGQMLQWMEHPQKEDFIDWKDDGFGNTMLHCAATRGRLDIVKILVEHGADITIANKNGSTALNVASRRGYTEIVAVLMEKGAALNTANNDGSTALMHASGKGHTDTVELLLDKDADLNIADEKGNTALMKASHNGHAEIVKLLMDKGADIAIANTIGWTALMQASYNGHTDAVKLLMKKGADISIANNKGETALSLAFKKGHATIVELLLKKGANHDIFNEETGGTVLLWASNNGYTNLVELLLDKDADVSVANNSGETALSMAFKKGHTNIVELLLDKGADCKIMNNQGRNAFSDAHYRGDTNMVELLLEKAPLNDIIHDVVKFSHLADKFLQLYQENREIVNWLDEDGRTVRQVACKACREAILFLGQYDLDDQPKYESPTCKIYHALDYGGRDETNLKEPRRVAMKFMEKKEHFLNEIRSRRTDDSSQRFSSEFVTPDLAAYCAEEDPHYSKACKTWNASGSSADLLPDQCIVMPLGERSLLESMNAENLSAKQKDLQRREILLSLCNIFSYLHDMGFVHGDIKPHNVVRHAGVNVTWKAIDFDSCTKVGDVVGLKLTTGSAPPEMLKIIKGEHASTEKVGESKVILRQRVGGLEESDLVLADPSFDVWSYGILLYQLVTGRSFFHCDLQGNVDTAGLHELANLTEESIHKKLDSVDDSSARVLLSRILRLDPDERPTMSEIAQDYYFHPSESPQGRKAEFFGKHVFGNSTAALGANQISRAEKNDAGSEDIKEIEKILSSKSEFSYFKLRDEDKDWNDKLLNSEVETFQFEKLGGMGKKPRLIDGDTIYKNEFLRGLLSTKGPDYFMGFLVEYFGLYKIMDDSHEVCQGIKANLVSNVKDLKGIFIKLFVRGKGLNDVVRGTLFCNSIEQFKYVGRQLRERYGHNVYIKLPKSEAGAWPIPKLLIYGNRRFDGRCMSVEIQFSTVYMHLATQASNNHLVYEAIRESTGYLGDKDADFYEFLQMLNEQYIDTEGFFGNQRAQKGRFGIVLGDADEKGGNETRHGESDHQYTTNSTGFISSGRICCGDHHFRFMSPTDRFQRFSESSFVVNKSLTLLSSHSYWSDEPFDLEGKTVEFVVSFKGRGLVIAGIGTAKCLHGATENTGGGGRCSVHVGRSKFVVRKNGVEEVFREKKLPDQKRAKIIFKMKDGMLLVSYVGSKRAGEEEIESVQVNMPSDQRYYLYMRAPPGVHDVKFHDISIPAGLVCWV